MKTLYVWLLKGNTSLVNVTTRGREECKKIHEVVTKSGKK